MVTTSLAAAPAPARRPRRRAMHMYGAVAMGSLTLSGWALLRVGMCWGRYEEVGWVGCNAHWLVGLAMVLGVVVLALLLADLARPHHESLRGQRWRRSRAMWRGYRELESGERRHVSASTLLMLAFVALCLVVVFWPGLRF